MSERSKWELYVGIFAVAMGVLYGGVQLLSLSVSGEYTEYFDVWWLAFEFVAGVFLLLRYRSDRFRRFSDAVGESRYYKAFWVFVSLVLAAFGGWLMYLVGLDFGSDGAVGVFGFGAVMCIFGLVAAGAGFRRLHHS